MFSSSVDDKRSDRRRASLRLLNYLNKGLLAFAMTIVIALLGKKPKANELPSGKATKDQLIAHNYQAASQALKGEVVQKEPQLAQLRQFADRVISALKGAFNDPSLINYANQQGMDIPGSAKLLNNSSQSRVPSRLPSRQSTDPL